MTPQQLFDTVADCFLAEGGEERPFYSLGLQATDDHQARLIADLRHTIHVLTPPEWEQRLRDIARWYALRSDSVDFTNEPDQVETKTELAAEELVENELVSEVTPEILAEEPTQFAQEA